MTPEEYEDHSRRLAVVAYRMGELVDELREANRQQEVTNAELRAFVSEQREGNREQAEFNRQQREFNADVKTTLAGIQTLLDHVLRGGANGREA